MRHTLRSGGRQEWIASLMTGFCALIFTACYLPARAQLQVLTQHNDNQRTGANLSETQLTPANVNSNQFGLLFTRRVDSLIYAQPLYVHKLDMPHIGRINVLFVATMANSVYAFDADSPTASAPLWHTNLGAAVDVAATFGTTYPEIAGGGGQIGAAATPVIDLPSQTLYVCCSTSDTPVGPYHTMLHALDITTGAEKPGSPVELTATLSPSTAAGAVHGALTFDSSQHMVRPALLLANGVVYICAGSHGDMGHVYHGWVFAYDAASLKQLGVYCVTLHSTAGAIWQSGAGPAADTHGNVYCITANGSNEPQKGDDGDSAIKLKLTPAGLVLEDYFTPFNAPVLSSADMDLGSTGPLLLPGTDYLVCGGKECKLYVLDTHAMGGVDYDASGNITDTDDDGRVVQWFEATTQPWVSGQSGVPPHHIHGTPVTFTNAAGQQFIYVWPENEYLKSFQLQNGLFDSTPFAQSAMLCASGMPGGFLSVSANGARNGIVWVSRPLSSAGKILASGCLEAFDATTLQLLYDTQNTGGRDAPGNYAKFVSPTVVNGKVYLATFSNSVAVYGLFPVLSPALTAKAVTASDVRLTWTDASKVVTNYRVERSTDGLNFTPIAQNVAGSATSYDDTSVQPLTSYYYRMQAVNSGVQSPFSPAVSVTTPAPPPAAPVLKSGTITYNSVDLSWSGAGVNSIIIEQSTDNTTFVPVKSLSGVPVWRVTPLVSHKTYYFRVYASARGGASPLSNVVTATTLNAPPASPQTLHARTVSQTEIDLTWTNRATNAASIVVQRSPDRIVWTPIATVSASANSYKDARCTAQSTYYYQVVAQNNGGVAASSIVTASTLPNLPVTPALYGTAASSMEVDLTWSAPGASVVLIERCTDNKSFRLLTTYNATAAAFNDTACRAGTTYYYRMRSQNAAGYSGYSATVTVTTPN